MTILGIDPGFARTGYGIIKKRGNSFEAIEYGSITTEAKTAFCDRLVQISQDLDHLIKTYKPQQCAIESLFFFKNIKTAISVASARGVLLLVPRQLGVEVFEYTPLQIKQAITGYGKAEKGQVTSMVRKILNIKNQIKLDDTADALATAICHANSANFQQKIITKSPPSPDQLN
ncbi:MAG: crossover junction endodeoxyribonuclease RuvC [Candidatus Moranbacteria bacterium]|nr:crossover junction endodeoxyribonuclease RuvC [Candidatus Moranbacteria bacterium]